MNKQPDNKWDKKQKNNLNKKYDSKITESGTYADVELEKMKNKK